LINCYDKFCIMKQYVIDEIRPHDQKRLKVWLDERLGTPDLGDIYWYPIDPGVYSKTQSAHTDCHPLYFTLHLRKGALYCELLVRTKNRIRCDCIAYATPAQRNWMIESIDALFESLDIRV